MSLQEMFGLDGKVAIVTGASAGLGVACAEGLAAAGADVVLAARRRERLSELAARIEATGRRALAVATDITDPEACEALAQAAQDAFGGVDVLVNNAGVGTAVPASRETPDQFSAVIDLNLSGVYWMAQAAARRMQPGASIINISSILGLTTASLPQAAYSASKAGVLGLTRDLAQQWGTRKGIRVNAICPGFFPSEMTDTYQEGYLDRMSEERALLGRIGRPEELAAAVVFLAGPGAGYCTGATFVVDGGVTIT